MMGKEEPEICQGAAAGFPVEARSKLTASSRPAAAV